MDAGIKKTAMLQDAVDCGPWINLSCGEFQAALPTKITKEIKPLENT